MAAAVSLDVLGILALLPARLDPDGGLALPSADGGGDERLPVEEGIVQGFVHREDLHSTATVAVCGR